MGSFSNVGSQGAFQGQGSFSNINSGSLSTQDKSGSTPQFEGNLIENIGSNALEIGANITTLIGGLLGIDQQASDAIANQIITAIKDPKQGAKDLGDALLSTYNLAVDDFGKMPLGEMVGNVLTGAWKHPIEAFLDVASLGQLTGVTKGLSGLSKANKTAQSRDVLVRAAEQATKDNIKIGTVSQDFVKEISDITRKYNPQTISKGMQAIETIGFKNAPRELLGVMQDLTRANDTYKMFTKMAGAELIDDVEFATRELIAKQYGISFDEAAKLKENSKLYRDVENYVIENDIRPLFHLKPEVHGKLTLDPDAPTIQSSLLERKFGTIDYNTAGQNLLNKAVEFADKVDRTYIAKSAKRINDTITKYNKDYNADIPKLNLSRGIINDRVLNELNSELKKVMLSSGTYLGANIITTTLSILNNFDLDAAVKTFKKLPKFKMIELAEAETPGIKLLSKFNNKLYRPIASVDRWLEQVATRYINEIGVDKYKLLQSTIPSRVVVTNPVLKSIKSLVPFGQYPAAAVQEIAANIANKPGKTLALTQLEKTGSPINQKIQEQSNIKFDRTKALRVDEKGQTIQRSTVITPIQAANMFLLGTQGDAIQIPILRFIEKLVSGTGDPHVFEVEGKQYRIDNQGNIHTNKGSFSMIPSLAYAGRNLIGPVNFYNQVLVPIMSDKYVKDDTKLFNTMVSDSQFANLNSFAKLKVTENAREKLGKRLIGTYEYKYFDDNKISKRVRQKVMRKNQARQSLERTLK